MPAFALALVPATTVQRSASTRTTRDADQPDLESVLLRALDLERPARSDAELADRYFRSAARDLPAIHVLDIAEAIVNGERRRLSPPVVVAVEDDRHLVGAGLGAVADDVLDRIDVPGLLLVVRLIDAGHAIDVEHDAVRLLVAEVHLALGRVAVEIEVDVGVPCERELE